MREKKSAEDCGYERISEGLEDEDSAQTGLAVVTSVSQQSTSFWRAVLTSSTEHFFEVTRAILDSSLRASRARASPGSGNTWADALRRRSLGKSSSISEGR